MPSGLAKSTDRPSSLVVQGLGFGVRDHGTVACDLHRLML